MMNDRQEGIDVAQLLRAVWNRRRFVITVAGIFLLAGFLFAIFGRVKYTASTVMIGGGSLAWGVHGLAAIAGINPGAMENAESIPPAIYPMVVTGTAFRKELMYSPVSVGKDGREADGATAPPSGHPSGGGESTTLLDYLVPRGGKYEGEEVLRTENPSLPIETLTRRESRCAKMLSRRLSVDVDRTDGYITIEVVMPEAVAAAEVAARAQKLLEEYVTRFKIEKVQAGLDFIEERYREAKADFEEKQRALARFRDNNLDLSSAAGRARESRFSDEYNLAFSIYSDLAARREQARIKVKEDTPVFTVVKPVTVPMVKSAPKRKLIVAGSLLLGLAVGVMLVFMLPGLARVFDTKLLKRWRT